MTELMQDGPRRQLRYTFQDRGLDSTCADCGKKLDRNTLGYWYDPDGRVGHPSYAVPASLYYCLPCGDRRFPVMRRK